jgi:hypothetical protein
MDPAARPAAAMLDNKMFLVDMADSWVVCDREA